MNLPTYLLTYLLNYLIIRIRRTIGHLTTIISCNKTGIFTNHQKKLKEKYKKTWKYKTTHSES